MMSDFKFIAFVVFLFIFFGAFMAVFESSQNEYVLSHNTTDAGVSGFDQIKSMAEFETGSEYGKLFLGGLLVLIGIVIIRFVRGQ